MHYVYVLQSLKNNNIYIGYTKNIRKRLLEHNRQKNISTKTYAPWKIIFLEIYIEQNDAKRRERYLKTSNGGRMLKRMLREYFYKHH